MKSEFSGTIACDIDDVLANTAPKIIEFSNQEFGTKLTVEDFSEDWPTMWRVDLDEADRRAGILHSSGIFSEFEIIEGSLEALIKLRSDGYKLVSATSRPRELASITEEWLNLKYPNLFNEFYHSGNFDGGRRETMHLATKRDLYKLIGPVAIIDDQPKHCVAAGEIGIESSILFGNHRWSNLGDCAVKGIIRCQNWAEVTKRLGLDRTAA